MSGVGSTGADGHGRVGVPSVHDFHVDNVGGFRFPLLLDSRQIVFDPVVVKLAHDFVVGVLSGVQFG